MKANYWIQVHAAYWMFGRKSSVSIRDGTAHLINGDMQRNGWRSFQYARCVFHKHADASANIVNVHLVSGQKKHSSGQDRSLSDTIRREMLAQISAVTAGEAEAEEPTAGIMAGDFNITSAAEFRDFAVATLEHAFCSLALISPGARELFGLGIAGLPLKQPRVFGLHLGKARFRLWGACGANPGALCQRYPKAPGHFFATIPELRGASLGRPVGL